MKTVFSLLFAMVLAPMSMFAAEAADISHDELKEAIKEKKVTLIDVNGSQSYKAGHIPGAIDFASSKDDLANKLPKDKSALVVAYCGNERCGAYKAGVKAAEALGYTNIKHYSKGIQGWKKAGEATEQ